MQTSLRATIREFTRQAGGFAAAPQIKDEEALRLACEVCAAGPQDTVLDVACGPGILACAVAAHVRHATGIDLTPAMIERARQLQQEQGLDNVEWRVGEAAPLPWPDASFSLVVCRYAFHHFREPKDVLREMTRVCRPGGRVCVIDVALPGDEAQVEAFNRMERLRDPSHVRAFSLEELCRLFTAAGLPVSNCAHYRLEFELNALLSGSFPVEGGEPVIREMFEESLSTDSMGLKPRLTGGRIRCSYPIAVIVSRKTTDN